MKKAAIVYVSYHHQNTEKIVKAIAEEINADVFNLKENPTINLAEYELLGLASGIYYSDVDKTLYKFLEEQTVLPNTIFAIITSGGNSEKNQKKFIKKLAAKGIECKAGFNCLGFDTFGPFKIVGGIAKGRPNQADIAAAKQFAKSLLVE